MTTVPHSADCGAPAYYCICADRLDDACPEHGDPECPISPGGKS